MQFINPQVGNFYAERVCGGMSTGRFRFSIAQPVRKNHPPPAPIGLALAGWCWLPPTPCGRRSAPSIWLHNGLLCKHTLPRRACSWLPWPLVRLRSVPGAPACNVSRAGAHASPTRRRLSVGRGFRCCRFLLRLNTAAITRDNYKLTIV